MNKEYFTIENKYPLPSWGDVTLRKYLSFLKFQKDCPDFLKVEGAQFTHQDYEGEGLKYIAKYIQFWTGCPIKELWQAEKEEVEKLYQLINERLKVDSSLFPHQQTVKFAGKEFVLGAKFMQRRTLGEYAQTAQLETMAQEQEGNPHFKLSKILCILLQEKGKEYDPEATEDKLYENESLFMSLPMNVVWMVVFFCQKRKIILERLIQYYTSRQQQRNEQQALRN